MAKTTVTTKKVTMRVESLLRAAAQNAEVREKLGSQFRRFAGKEMTKVVTNHFQEAINQAASLVDSGVSGAASGRDVTVKTAYGAVTLGFWESLTHKYRTYKKRSFPGTEKLFWKRTGNTGKYLLNLAIAVKSAHMSNIKTEAAAGGKSKVSVRIMSTITAPSTGDPTIDRMMRDSFVQGSPTFLPGASKGQKILTPAGIVAVNEATRPLMSQLAATLGIRAMQAIRNIKQ
jgi:hypothetical protein